MRKKFVHFVIYDKPKLLLEKDMIRIVCNLTERNGCSKVLSEITFQVLEGNEKTQFSKGFTTRSFKNTY